MFRNIHSGAMGSRESTATQRPDIKEMVTSRKVEKDEVFLYKIYRQTEKQISSWKQYTLGRLYTHSNKAYVAQIPPLRWLSETVLNQTRKSVVSSESTHS